MIEVFRPLTAGIAALLMSVVSGMAEPRELKFSLFTPEHFWVYETVFVPFANEVEKRTGGELKITFYTGGALGNATQQLQLVESGMADLTWFPTVYSRNRFPYSEAALLPFLFDNATGASAAMMSTMDQYLEAEFDTVKLISIAVTSPSALLTTRPVNSLADLQGLNIRGSGGAQTKLLRMLGANVTSVSVDDNYLALQRGLLDGTIYPLAAAPGANLHEVIRYVNRLNFSASPVAILANLEMWNSLTDEQRDIILEAGREASVMMGQGYDAEDQIGLEKILAAGGQETELPLGELEQIKQKGEELWDEWVEEMKAKRLDPEGFLTALQQASDAAR